MTLAQLYAILEGLATVGESGKSGTELVAAIKAEIKAKNDQEQNLRTRAKTALEALGLKLDSETLEADAKGLKVRLDEKDPQGLSAKVAELEGKLTTQTDAATKAAEKATGMKKKQAIMAALTEAKVKSPQLYVDQLAATLDLEEADDGDKFTLKIGGKAYSKMGEGVTEWLKDKAHLVENPVKGGGGGGPGSGGHQKAPGGGGDENTPATNPGDKLRQAREQQTTT